MTDGILSTRTEETYQVTALDAQASMTYSGPPSYRIGDHDLKHPFVSIPQIKAHLALLRAFKELRTTVQETDAKSLNLPPVVSELTKDKRWTWFVGLAVERFQRWLGTIVSKSQSAVATDTFIGYCMPPLDVLMVWHSYLLNPSWYNEDCDRQRALAALNNYKSVFVDVLIKIGDINGYTASVHRMAEWQKATGTPWDPQHAMTHLSHRNVICPKCDRTTSAPLMTASNTGYLQHEFSLTCSKCEFVINMENLAVNKFASDLGTLYSPSTLRNQAGAGRLLKSIQGQSFFKRKGEHMESLRGARNVLRGKAGGKISSIRTYLGTALVRAGVLRHVVQLTATADHQTTHAICFRINRIMRAYTDDRPFSVDLVGAVIRQGSFVDKMHAFGWTEPKYFDNAVDEVVIVHAVARYHAFLDLLHSVPNSLFVPTLDIDLVWHTHQLMGFTYASDTIKHVRRFIDHYDKIEEGFLSNALDLTCRAWQQRYDVSYMHCGCPLPGDTIGEKLSRMTSRFTSSSSSSTSPDSSLEPPDHNDALSATHASNHNCVSIPRESDKVREQRLKKISKRRDRDVKLVAEGKMTKEALDRNLSHDAYLYPVPFYSPPVVSCGAYPAFMEFGSWKSGCAVASAVATDQGHVQLATADVVVELGVAAEDAEVRKPPGSAMNVHDHRDRDQRETILESRQTIRPANFPASETRPVYLLGDPSRIVSERELESAGPEMFTPHLSADEPTSDQPARKPEDGVPNILNSLKRPRRATRIVGEEAALKHYGSEFAPRNWNELLRRVEAKIDHETET
ncbi:hypothetical protein EIP91_010319 [Steccherinum ochraceum]|uniref:Uncharacterized protein n=1 Tax=Steccherinum ochraceum TaxID=92696 RepID=A0A4R0R8Q0_9APHY|nr:hypothetical protein EIP91_010319 [Steccherinum ochraceum]